jgi:hypothetical protein
METPTSDVEDGDLLTCTIRPSGPRRQPPTEQTMEYQLYRATRVSHDPNAALDNADDQAASTGPSLWLLTIGGALP